MIKPLAYGRDIPRFYFKICALCFLAVLFCCRFVSFSASAEGEHAVGTNANPLNNYSGNTLDTVSLSTANETPLGLAAADAVLRDSGADIAIVCGGDLGMGIDAGTVCQEDVEQAFTGNYRLAVARISPAQLKEILEYDLSAIVVGEDEYIDRESSQFDAYPQIAGFTCRYDPTAPPGGRIMSLRLDGGGELDLSETEPTLTLCTTETQLSGAYGYSPSWDWTPTGRTIQQAMSAYLSEGISTAYSRENRTLEYGVNDNSIYSRLPYGLVFLLILIALLCNGTRFKNRFRVTR